MVKFLDLAKQYQSIKEEIDAAISNVIADSAFIGGKYVEKFEAEFAEFVSVPHCIGVGNGTDALEIALEAANLPKNSEIIVPGNSFIASAEAVTRSGHRVVFADVNPRNFTLCPKDVQRKITDRTSGVIAVHLYGHPCDMDPLLELSNKHDLTLIEDCAQAHGAMYKGRPVGSIGHMAAFSFYPGKNLGAYGDAGAITTRNAELAIKARMIANHGRKEKYDHLFEGRNSRLDGLQAAILSVKLRHLNQWTDARIEIASFYLDQLQGLKGIILSQKEDWAKHVYHLFVIQAVNRDELKRHLAENGIESAVHYPIALPKLKAYSYTNTMVSNTYYGSSDNTLLSLPMGDHMTEKDVHTVVKSVQEYVRSTTNQLNL